MRLCSGHLIMKDFPSCVKNRYIISWIKAILLDYFWSDKKPWPNANKLKFSKYDEELSASPYLFLFYIEKAAVSENRGPPVSEEHTSLDRDQKGNHIFTWIYLLIFWKAYILISSPCLYKVSRVCTYFDSLFTQFLELNFLLCVTKFSCLRPWFFFKARIQ